MATLVVVLIQLGAARDTTVDVVDVDLGAAGFGARAARVDAATTLGVAVDFHCGAADHARPNRRPYHLDNYRRADPCRRQRVHGLLYSSPDALHLCPGRVHYAL